MERPATEQANPLAAGLDEKSTVEIVRLIHREDLRAWEAVGGALDTIVEVVDAVVRAFRWGGRLIYLGAGTSGRLGVLDASECPPTFGVAPDQVQAFIAGGDEALRSAKEGAEDSYEDGGLCIAGAAVRERDVVCGIAASGNTPFVWGGLEEALRRDATTVMITSNPDPSTRWPVHSLDFRITLLVGPEVIAGSTRMKAGTATKMVLNMITTTAMIRWGKVYDNVMVDVVPASRKLKLRARTLVESLAGADSFQAEELLKRSGGRVKVAVLLWRGALSVEDASDLLERHGDSLRAALGELGRRGQVP